MANSFNRYFITKITEIEQNQPDNNIDPMDYYKKYVPNFKNTFSFKQVNMSQLRKQLSSIKNTNSTDIFGISMNMIKKN